MLCSRLDKGDVVSTCTHNRDAAAAVGRKDLVQVGQIYLRAVMNEQKCENRFENEPLCPVVKN